MDTTYDTNYSQQKTVVRWDIDAKKKIKEIADVKYAAADARLLLFQHGS
jgi:hypothetical protein